VTKNEIRARIEEIGIIPGIRVPSAADARFAAEAVNRGGIPIAEITMTVPEAMEVSTGLTRGIPEMIVGAGTILDIETARRCLDAGAKFLTSPGLVLEVVEFAAKNDVIVFPVALTPTEGITAWNAGADFVKIYPCAPVGGDSYIRDTQGSAPACAADCLRECEPTNCVEFYSCGSHRPGNRRGVDSQRRCSTEERPSHP
jgi:2-dehydro-3-deoxyphosphogluconate aldolase / (4S)-4-hydroxy-2-oxoglutarate aldolase